MWYSNTPLHSTSLCFYGGIVVGTQPEGATWSETKMDGDGYAITINSKNAIVEGMRVHNHHDGFVPYRSDGFTYRGNWQNYTRDDCIENDAGAEGTVTDNLFDGCFVFFSNTGGAAGDAAGSSGILRITNNLIRMEPMPGPPFGGAGVESGNPSVTSHGALFKVQPDFEDTIPQIVLRDNVIAYMPSGAKNTLKSLGRIADHQSTLASQCSNNTVLWLGSGPFPYAISPNVRKCFNIIGGSQAQQRWQQERQADLADIAYHDKRVIPAVYRCLRHRLVLKAVRGGEHDGHDGTRRWPGGARPTRWRRRASAREAQADVGQAQAERRAASAAR